MRGKFCRLLALFFVMVQVSHLDRINRGLGDYHALGAPIEKNSVLMSLDFEPDDGFQRFRPYQHAIGRIAIEKNAVDLSNYEAQTDHFQVRLAPHVSAPNYNQLMGDPGSLDVARYAPVVRYILVRHMDKAPAAFKARMERLYRVVKKNPAGELYKRRDAAADVRVMPDKIVPLEPSS